MHRYSHSLNTSCCRQQEQNKFKETKPCAFSELNPWVAKLVKSFGAPYEITESLDDFRYEPNHVFSVEDALGFVSKVQNGCPQPFSFNQKQLGQLFDIGLETKPSTLYLSQYLVEAQGKVRLQAAEVGLDYQRLSFQCPAQIRVCN